MNQRLRHPTTETLSAFSLGQLPPDDAQAIEDHIVECEPCCETLMGLASDDTFVALLQEANEPTDETLDQPATSTKAGVADIIPQPVLDHPRYSIVAPIGKGGMGNVFKAEHRLMERTVALKVIKREFFRNPDAVQRFHREVKSAARLSHPNIVTAHDAEQAGDVNFLVMEYVEGVDLARRVREQGALPIDEACHCIYQTALGLQHAHEQGMVHRDIKPHNLMLTDDGTVKILDFGLATLASAAFDSEVRDRAEADADSGTSELTVAGMMMGTPDFISPEQASTPHAVDIRSDIYSLGCTFYYLLSGRAPFPEGSPVDKLRAHVQHQAEPIGNVRANLPDEIADIVGRMLEKDPELRFQSPADVANVLAEFVDRHRTTRPSPVTRPPQRGWWPPSLIQTTIVTALLVVLGAMITIATDRGTLKIESVDPNVEITLRPVQADKPTQQGNDLEFDILDTITGSTVTRLRSGEYQLDIKNDNNQFDLSQERFVLKRGETVIVTVAASEDDSTLPVDFEFLPEPWVDGEALRYQINLANGLDIGTFVVSTTSTEHDGQPAWLSNIGRYIRLNAPNQGFGRVVIDRETFWPITSRFHHALLGDFTAQFGTVDVTVTANGGGEQRIDTKELPHKYFDSQQMMHLLRRLPLTEDYKTKIPIFISLADGPMDFDLNVAGKETVETPAGNFECFRVEVTPVQETLWISTDENRYPVKFRGEGITGVLVATRVAQPGESIEFLDHEVGFSLLATPSAWHVVKDPDTPKDADDPHVYRLLDPNAEALSILRVRSRELLTDHNVDVPRTLAEMRVKKRTQMLKDFSVREESWTERTIGGHTGISFISDHTERDKSMVHYYVCSFGDQLIVEFITIMERDKFDAFKADFDAIIASYREISTK